MELGIPSSGATFVAALDVLPFFELAEVFFLFHFGNDAVAQLADSGGKDSCFYIRRMIIINNYFQAFYTPASLTILLLFGTYTFWA